MTCEHNWVERGHVIVGLGWSTWTAGAIETLRGEVGTESRAVTSSTDKIQSSASEQQQQSQNVGAYYTRKRDGKILCTATKTASQYLHLENGKEI